MSIRFEMRDKFGDGITVEVTEKTIRFYDGCYQNSSFTKEQFFCMVVNVEKALEQLRMR